MKIGTLIIGIESNDQHNSFSKTDDEWSQKATKDLIAISKRATHFLDSKQRTLGAGAGDKSSLRFTSSMVLSMVWRIDGWTPFMRLPGEDFWCRAAGNGSGMRHNPNSKRKKEDGLKARFVSHIVGQEKAESNKE